MSEYDFTREADEIERLLGDLIPRAKAVVQQLRAGELLGEVDPVMAALTARSLAESLQGADCRITAALRERREQAIARKDR